MSKVTTSFRIEEDVLEEIKRMADTEGRTVSNIIQRMLDRGINEGKTRAALRPIGNLKTENDAKPVSIKAGTLTEDDFKAIASTPGSLKGLCDDGN